MQRCMQEDFHGNLEMVNLKNNKIFLDEFATLIRDSLSQSISRLGERTNLFQSLSSSYFSYSIEPEVGPSSFQIGDL
jgi:hypothetical protein